MCPGLLLAAVKGLSVVKRISRTKGDALHIPRATTSSGAGRARREGKVYKMKRQRYTLRYECLKLKIGNEGKETMCTTEIKQQR